MQTVRDTKSSTITFVLLVHIWRKSIQRRCALLLQIAFIWAHDWGARGRYWHTTYWGPARNRRGISHTLWRVFWLVHSSMESIALFQKGRFSWWQWRNRVECRSWCWTNSDKVLYNQNASKYQVYFMNQQRWKPEQTATHLYILKSDSSQQSAHGSLYI